MEALFVLSTVLVLPCWLLLIALPGWRWTARLAASPLIVAPPAVLYTLLLLPSLGTLLPLFVRPAPADVAALLGTADGATLAWAHFLTLDLFAGRWVYLDGRRQGRNPWALGAALCLILAVAPLGLLLYLGWRTVAGRRRDAAGRRAPGTA